MAAPPQATVFLDRLPPYALTRYRNRGCADRGGDIAAIPSVTVFHG
jgi:hypothetical protein